MRPLLALLLVLSGSTSLHAQWHIALLHGNATTHGDARADIDPDHPELRADRPATWSIAFVRDIGRWQIAANIHRTTADLSETGASSSVSTSGILVARGTGLEVGRRIAGNAGGPALVAGAGIRLDRWTFDLVNNAPRTRVAAQGALTAELPISQRWRAMIRGEVLVGPSVFSADELPEGFSLRTATRHGISLGVAWRMGRATRP